jgi:hypothetical protein
MKNTPIIHKDYYCMGVAREGATGTTDELENMRLHEERVERLLLQHGNQSLSSFLNKMSSSV